MPAVRVAAVAAAFIADIVLTTSASAAPAGPGAKMSGADPVYGSIGGTGPPKTCSGFFDLCTSRYSGSPRCANARAKCMQTGVWKRASDGHIFNGLARR
jgi:hypothetical protein